MLDQRDLYRAISRIRYRDWTFRIIDEGGAFLIQCRFVDADSGDGQQGRKWRISKNATVSEVIQTAFAAVLAAEEHEAREKFTVDGKAVFHPHHDIEALLLIVDRTDARAPMPDQAAGGMF